MLYEKPRYLQEVSSGLIRHIGYVIVQGTSRFYASFSVKKLEFFAS